MNCTSLNKLLAVVLLLTPGNVKYFFWMYEKERGGLSRSEGTARDYMAATTALECQRLMVFGNAGPCE